MISAILVLVGNCVKLSENRETGTPEISKGLLNDDGLICSSSEVIPCAHERERKSQLVTLVNSTPSES